MATVLAEKYGNSAGPNEYAQFQTYAAIGYSQKDDVKGYYIQIRCYVTVSTGDTGFQGTIAHCNWGYNWSSDFNLYTSGTYADSGWTDVGWLAPGKTYTLNLGGDTNATAYYDSSSGTRYSSSATTSYTASSKTVTYNANGGSGAPNSQTTLADATITLSSSTRPTKTGYTFKGWATSSAATTAQYQPGDQYTAQSSVTLYAVWQINTWAVSYNNNGGSGSIANQTKTYNQALTLSNGSGFSKTGYTLKSWNTNSAGTGTTYNLGASYTGNAALALYAKWQINTWTVSYNQNTTDSVSNMPSNQTKTYGQTLTLSSNTPTRTGYDFQGWATSSGSMSVAYKAGASYTNNSAATLYAVWTLKTYTVSYDKNTTATVSNMPSSQTKTHFTNLTLSSNKPTRQQYEFLGWSTSSTGGVVYQPGGTYSAEQSTTLYAVWELSASKVTVYDSNGTAHTGLFHIYDDNGNVHYGIITIYDAQGNPRSVI